MTQLTTSTRQYLEHSHYYVQGHPAILHDLFLDEQDYAVFLNIAKRYLRTTHRNRLELEAFCLLPHDFYLCLYQRDATALTNFMRLLSVAYSTYFAQRHDKPGPLYKQHYRASLVNRSAHLLPMTRYIHRLPQHYETWPWSSLDYFTARRHADWVRPERIMAQSPAYYSQFVAAGTTPVHA